MSHDEDFYVEDDHDEWFGDDEQADHPSDEDVLDQRRIKLLTAERRALSRYRVWCLVGAAVLAGGTLRLGVAVWEGISRSQAIIAIGAGALMVFALLALVYLLRLAGRIAAELQTPLTHSLPPVDHTPDFSQLSDGSQLTDALDQMVEGQDREPPGSR